MLLMPATFRTYFRVNSYPIQDQAEGDFQNLKRKDLG